MPTKNPVPYAVTYLLAELEAMRMPSPVTEYDFAKPRRWRFDLAWPGLQLAVEVEGGTWVAGRHTRGDGYRKDCEKYNAAVLLGFRVLRFTTEMVESGEAAKTIKEALLV